MDSATDKQSWLQKWRRQVAFYLEDIETPLGLGVNLLILVAIVASSGIFVALTYNLPPRVTSVLTICDRIILVLFTLEYGLRLWSAEDKRQFFFSIFSAIDLAAILPLLLGWLDIRFFRLFRWFRLLRIIRFWQLETKLLGIKSGESTIFVRIFLTLFSIIFTYAGLIYQVEHQLNSKSLDNFLDAFYFVVVTMTTVGYGDVTPISQAGPAMTLMMILTGGLFIPWQLSELVSQVAKKVNLVEVKCSRCGLARHDPDAQYCKQCGEKLGAKSG